MYNIYMYAVHHCFGQIGLVNVVQYEFTSQQ